MSISRNPEQSPRPERIQSPEVAKRAAAVINTVEQASECKIPRLDTVVPGENVLDLVEEHVERTDHFYDRHNQLFFNPDDAHGGQRKLDIEAVIRLCNDMVREFNGHQRVRHGLMAGLGVMQFAAAGAQIAHNPSMVHVAAPSFDMTSPEGVKAIAEKAGMVNIEAFREYTGWPYGDIDQLSNPRMGYLGNLLSTHHAFLEYTYKHHSHDKELENKIRDSLIRLPSKVLYYDIHSGTGRPDRQMTLANFRAQHQRFIDSLTNKERSPAPMEVNVGVAMEIIDASMTALFREGYEPEESFQIIAQNTNSLGRLIEHTSQAVTLSLAEGFTVKKHDNGNVELLLPPVNIETPWLSVKKDDAEDTEAKRTIGKKQSVFNRRNEVGGHCPARYPIPIPPEGQTHQNIKKFSESVEETIGVPVPFISVHNGQPYVNFGALSLNYSLLAFVYNYRASVTA